MESTTALPLSNLAQLTIGDGALLNRPAHEPIPEEIINLIIDEVALIEPPSDRLTALKSCSLVCKSLSELARRHLFSSITIWNGDERHQAKVSAIRSILTISPGVSMGVTKLDLILSPECSESDLSSLLTRLKNLRTLSFRFASRNARHEWSFLSTATRNALLDILLSNSLTNLSIANVYDIPDSLLSRMVDIPCVTISSISLLPQANPSVESANTTSTVCRLEKLIAHVYMGFMFRGGINNNDYTMQAASVILQHYGAVLTTFECWRMDTAIQPFDLSTLPQLRTIKLYSGSVTEKPLQYAYKILNTALDDNEIAEIYLDVGFAQLSRNDPVLDELDMLLSDRRFTRLTKVKFKVDTPYQRGDEKETRIRMLKVPILMQVALPGLNERGLIGVAIKIGRHD